MKWLPNPYALARQLTNAPEIGRIFSRGGKATDNFLREALVSGRKPQTMIEAVAVFERIAASFKNPVTLSQAIEESKQVWAEEGYTDDEIARVLPNLVPLVDATSTQEFSDADHLIVKEASYLDPVQGAVGNCYLISAMIALAWAETGKLTERLNFAGFNPPGSSFRWLFHERTGPTASEVTVTGRILMSGAIPLNARSTSPVEDWPSLVEKAYVAHVCGPNVVNGEPTQANYQSTDAMTEGTMPPVACRALLGGKRRGADLSEDRDRKIFLEGALATLSGVMTKPVMAWTNTVENMRQPLTRDGIDLNETSRDVWKETGLWPRHAYAVLGVMLADSAVEHVVLRNPHGAPTDPNDRLGYHEGPWMPDGRPPVPLNQDGVFAISRDLFYANFVDIGWNDHSDMGGASV